MIKSSVVSKETDLEVEPPGQETPLSEHADDRVKALGVVWDEMQQLPSARLLSVS